MTDLERDPIALLECFALILRPHRPAGEVKDVKWKAVLTFTTFSAAMKGNTINIQCRIAQAVPYIFIFIQNMGSQSKCSQVDSGIEGTPEFHL